MMQWHLLSALLEHGQTRASLEPFLIQAIENPDPGSYFDRLTQEMRATEPRERWVDILVKERGYDSLLLLSSDGTMSGRVAWQRQDDCRLHMFSVHVDPHARGCGHALEAFRHLVRHGKTLPGVIGLKLGEGGSEANMAIMRAVKREEVALGIRVYEPSTGLVDFI